MINRFTKDVESMDITLASGIGAFLSIAASAVASVITIVWISPYFLIATIPLGAIYW